MNRLNELFSSQDFHINFDDRGIVSDIHIGSNNASTETARRSIYQTSDGLLTVDKLLDKLRGKNLPINVNLGKINTKAKLGGASYNIAIA